MKVLTINELLCLTRIELTELHASLSIQLAELPEGSSEETDTLVSLQNIRAVLARPEFQGHVGYRGRPTPTVQI
jgi:hypothetical protein